MAQHKLLQPIRLINNKGNWTRLSVAAQKDRLFIFTDNTDRNSGTGIISRGSSYYRRYGDGIHDLHFPTRTSAVIRGLENALPVSTQRWYNANYRGAAGRWQDENIEDFKEVIDEEFRIIREEMVRRALSSDSGQPFEVVLPEGGLTGGEISGITEERTPQLYAYLHGQEKSLEFVAALFNRVALQGPVEEAEPRKGVIEAVCREIDIPRSTEVQQWVAEVFGALSLAGQMTPKEVDAKGKKAEMDIPIEDSDEKDIPSEVIDIESLAEAMEKMREGKSIKFDITCPAVKEGETAEEASMKIVGRMASVAAFFIEGADLDFSNPFAVLGTPGSVRPMDTTKAAVEAFDAWLTGREYLDVEPKRREAVLAAIFSGTLMGKPVVLPSREIPYPTGYDDEVEFSHDGARSHADVLLDYINDPVLLAGRINENNAIRRRMADAVREIDTTGPGELTRWFSGLSSFGKDYVFSQDILSQVEIALSGTPELREDFSYAMDDISTNLVSQWDRDMNELERISFLEGIFSDLPLTVKAAMRSIATSDRFINRVETHPDVVIIGIGKESQFEDIVKQIPDGTDYIVDTRYRASVARGDLRLNTSRLGELLTKAGISTFRKDDTLSYHDVFFYDDYSSSKAVSQSFDSLVDAIKEGHRVVLFTAGSVHSQGSAVAGLGQELYRRGLRVEYRSVLKDGAVKSTSHEQEIGTILNHATVHGGSIGQIHFHQDGTYATDAGMTITERVVNSRDRRLKKPNFGNPVQPVVHEEGNLESVTRDVARGKDFVFIVTGRDQAYTNTLLTQAEHAADPHSVVRLTVGRLDPQMLRDPQYAREIAARAYASVQKHLMWESAKNEFFDPANLNVAFVGATEHGILLERIRKAATEEELRDGTLSAGMGEDGVVLSDEKDMTTEAESRSRDNAGRPRINLDALLDEPDSLSYTGITEDDCNVFLRNLIEALEEGVSIASFHEEQIARGDEPTFTEEQVEREERSIAEAGYRIGRNDLQDRKDAETMFEADKRPSWLEDTLTKEQALSILSKVTDRDYSKEEPFSVGKAYWNLSVNQKTVFLRYFLLETIETPRLNALMRSAGLRGAASVLNVKRTIVDSSRLKKEWKTNWLNKDISEERAWELLSAVTGRTYPVAGVATPVKAFEALGEQERLAVMRRYLIDYVPQNRLISLLHAEGHRSPAAVRAIKEQFAAAQRIPIQKGIPIVGVPERFVNQTIIDNLDGKQLEKALTRLGSRPVQVSDKEINQAILFTTGFENLMKIVKKDYIDNYIETAKEFYLGGYIHDELPVHMREIHSNNTRGFSMAATLAAQSLGRISVPEFAPNFETVVSTSSRKESAPVEVRIFEDRKPRNRATMTRTGAICAPRGQVEALGLNPYNLGLEYVRQEDRRNELEMQAKVRSEKAEESEAAGLTPTQVRMLIEGLGYKNDAVSFMLTDTVANNIRIRNAEDMYAYLLHCSEVYFIYGASHLSPNLIRDTMSKMQEEAAREREAGVGMLVMGDDAYPEVLRAWKGYAKEEVIENRGYEMEMVVLGDESGHESVGERYEGNYLRLGPDADIELVKEEVKARGEAMAKVVSLFSNTRRITAVVNQMHALYGNAVDEYLKAIIKAYTPLSQDERDTHFSEATLQGRLSVNDLLVKVGAEPVEEKESGETKGPGSMSVEYIVERQRAKEKTMQMTVNEHSPALLHYQGDPSVLSRPTVRLAGSSFIPTAEAIGAARMCGRELAQQGIVLVTSLRNGSNMHAVQAALDEGGKVVLVSPFPLDRPKDREIIERVISQGGCVLSERPNGSRWRDESEERIKGIIGHDADDSFYNDRTKAAIIAATSEGFGMDNDCERAEHIATVIGRHLLVIDAMRNTEEGLGLIQGLITDASAGVSAIRYSGTNEGTFNWKDEGNKDILALPQTIEVATTGDGLATVVRMAKAASAERDSERADELDTMRHEAAKKVRKPDYLKVTDYPFDVVRCGEREVFVVPAAYKDVRDTVRKIYGEDITFAESNMEAKGLLRGRPVMVEGMMVDTFDGWKGTQPLPDMLSTKHLLYHDFSVYSMNNAPEELLPDAKERKADQKLLAEFRAEAKEFIKTLNKNVDMEGMPAMRFGSGRYLVVTENAVELYQGMGEEIDEDRLLASVSIGRDGRLSYYNRKERLDGSEPNYLHGRTLKTFMQSVNDAFYEESYRDKSTFMGRTREEMEEVRLNMETGFYKPEDIPVNLIPDSVLGSLGNTVFEPKNDKAVVPERIAVLIQMEESSLRKQLSERDKERLAQTEAINDLRQSIASIPDVDDERFFELNNELGASESKLLSIEKGCTALRRQVASYEKAYRDLLSFSFIRVAELRPEDNRFMLTFDGNGIDVSNAVAAVLGKPKEEWDEDSIDVLTSFLQGEKVEAPWAETFSKASGKEATRLIELGASLDETTNSRKALRSLVEGNERNEKPMESEDRRRTILMERRQEEMTARDEEIEETLPNGNRIICREGMYALANKEMTLISSFYPKMEQLGAQRVIVTGEDGKQNVLNKLGKKVFERDYDEIREGTEKMGLVRRGDLWNYVNWSKNGKILNPYVWMKEARPFNEGVGAFSAGPSEGENEGKWNFMDKEGSVLSGDEWFDSVEDFHEGKGVGYIGNTEVAIDIDGEELYRKEGPEEAEGESENLSNSSDKEY